MPGHRGEIKQIKNKVMEMFGDRIKKDFSGRIRANSNLEEWEKTFLKTFSRYKGIFLKNKAAFCVNSSIRTATDDASLAI